MNKSGDFGEEQRLQIKAGTVICFKCFHVCRSTSKIPVHIRWTLLNRGLKIVTYFQNKLCLKLSKTEQMTLLFIPPDISRKSLVL